MTKRPTRQERGYDARHFRERARWQRRMDRGEVIPCARCGKPVDPTNWALDHTDDRTAYLGPSHPRCNNSAGGTASAATRPSTKRPAEQHPGVVD